MSLLESFGAGLQNAGEVLSPQVYEKNAIERREQAVNALPNMLRQIQIARAQREEAADKQFAAAVKGANPGMTSSALLDAVQAVDPSVLATSPAAQTYLQYVNQRQQREQAVERERLRLQAAQDRLNKPTEHVVNGKLVRSYVDGRTEVVDLPAPTTSGGSTRFSISPKDYTPASLQKYGQTGKIGDLVPIKSGEGQLSSGGGPASPKRDYDSEYKKLDLAGQTALDMQAWNYINKNILPYRKGGGGGADRNDPIIHRAGQIANELGMTAQELSSKSAEFKSNAQSLAGMTKKLNAMQATLESFHNNIATWESIAEGEVPKLGGAKLGEIRDKLKKIDLSGVKTLNDWEIMVRTQFNDPAMVAYVTSAFTVAMDFSRIISSQGQSAAAVTEGARNEALKLVAAGYDRNSRKALIGTLESDAAGQINGQETQVNRQRKKLGLRGEPSTADPAGGREDPLGIRGK